MFTKDSQDLFFNLLIALWFMVYLTVFYKDKDLQLVQARKPYSDTAT